MSLTFWNRTPLLDEFARARDEMDRMLGRTFGMGMPMTEMGFTRPEGWLPPVDVSESDDEVMVRFEAPGVNPRDIDISISGTTLNITGKKEEKEECEGEDFYRCERRFGSFRRAIDLPESVDADRVSADSENGVITVHIAKRPGAKPRRVEVKSESKPTSRRIPVPG